MGTPEQETLEKVCEGYAFPLDDIMSEEFNRGLHVGVTWERERAKVLVEALEWYTIHTDALVGLNKAKEALAKYRGGG